MTTKEGYRKSGIVGVDNVPWGTHVCQYYETKQDFIKTIVPYVKTGLEHNELCVWITGDRVADSEVKICLNTAIHNFQDYWVQGQIELLSYDEVYLRDGVFQPLSTAAYWPARVEHALAAGYDGLRMVGDVDWLTKSDWDSFLKYEGEMHLVLSAYPMLALCAFPFDLITLGEAMALSRNHHLTVVNGHGVKSVVRDPADLVRLPRIKEMSAFTPLQQFFVTVGSSELKDIQLIEVILSPHLPSGVAKQKARLCLDRFESLRGFLAASSEELEAIGIPPMGILSIRMLQLLPAEVLKREISQKPVCKSSREIFDYLYFSMRDLKREVFKAIYLDSRSQIVKVDDLFEGGLKGVSVEVRKIQERALGCNAAAIIFVHNHPSGNPSPSVSDRKLTRDLVFTGIVLQIEVIDHIIVGDNCYFSFADEGFLEKYRDEFVHLRIRSVV